MTEKPTYDVALAALRGHFHGNDRAPYAAPGHAQDRDDCWHCHEAAEVVAEAFVKGSSDVAERIDG